MTTLKRSVSIGSDVFSAELEDFEQDNSNIRLIPGDIESLAVQLFTEGQLEPLICIKVAEGAKLSVWNGSRRIRAFHLARQFKVTVIAGKGNITLDGRTLRQVDVAPHPEFNPKRVLFRLIDGDPTPTELISLQLSIGSGVPFTRLERLSALKEILRCEKVEEQGIANFSKKCGVLPHELRAASKLFELDPAVRKAIGSSRVSPELGIRIVKLIPKDRQEKFLEESISAAKKRLNASLHLDRKWNEFSSKVHPKDCPWREYRKHGKGSRIRTKQKFKNSLSLNVTKIIAELDQQVADFGKSGAGPISESAKLKIEGIHLFGEYLKSHTGDDSFFSKLMKD
jgi:hypothetical protein